jgi:hypothetical protein
LSTTKVTRLEYRVRRGQRTNKDSAGIKSHGPTGKKGETEGKPVRWEVVGWLALSGGNLFVGIGVRGDEHPLGHHGSLSQSLLILGNPGRAVV